MSVLSMSSSEDVNSPSKIRSDLDDKQASSVPFADSDPKLYDRTNHRDGNTAFNPFEAFRGLHTKLFETSVIRSIDPLRCLSIRRLRSRSICSWGIRMIRQTILGQRNARSFIRGFVSTGKFSVLVQIPDHCFDMVVDHFINEGKSTEVATSLAKTGPWYHVVDGGHLHAALVELIEDFSENFARFKWPVVIIAWTSVDKIRAISRMCHEMQRDAHLIDYTLPDAMQNLRDIVDTQCRRQGIILSPGEKVRNGFIKEVMAEYSGRPGYADNTMRNMCGIVVKLSSEVIHSIRLLLTEECETYCEQLGSRRPFGDDTRVYKKLISSQSLKGVKLFLGGGMRDEDKINVIHRLRFLARERESFKSFSSAEVEMQCQKVIAAPEEVIRFDDFLEDESWPAEMDNLHRNMLQSTLLDRDISEHVANAAANLLPVLTEAYIKSTGLHGSQKLRMYKKRLGKIDQDAIEAENDNRGVVGSMALAHRTADLEDALGTGEKKISIGEGASRSRRDAEDVLKSCGVLVQRSTLLEFERNSTDLERSFDFMLADPYQKIPCPPTHTDKWASGHPDALIDDKGIKIYLQCTRRLLVPGGHSFIFLGWKNVAQWAVVASECMFEMICEPFLVIKDASKVQKMTMKGLQSLCEPALVLRKPGKHPSGFKVDKNSPYENLPNCKMPRWSNIIDGVPPPAERLTFKPTKVHVRPTEKPYSLFVELLRTFCPQYGNVLDPSAGALTTGMACIGTKRSCILLESDDHCLAHALPRLVAFAEAQVHMDTGESTSSDETRQPEKDLVATQGENSIRNVFGLESDSQNPDSWKVESSNGKNIQATGFRSKSRESGCLSVTSSVQESSVRADDSEDRSELKDMHVGKDVHEKKRANLKKRQMDHSGCRTGLGRDEEVLDSDFVIPAPSSKRNKRSR